MELLTNLCNLLNEQKNLYAMRGLYRTISLSQNQIQGISQQLAAVLQKFISDTAKEESDQNPNYIYTLFETTALTLKYLKGCK